ncbi:TetR/AcrR family transcriptional regulator [Streptomyces gilvosporeus]|uniref:TetR family transcriptional regulator n=1 Tax=Streptomyces gilvosporeus TaxID=553510 RepID=A0A1V0TS92_9ACTN|nr:TetR/AcrR family transcriptional regulator [Streptomyces gilvosporeus]ARF55819.1 TetR family transcriptional regulator [Streptomyces gilvosporeus]
MNDTPKGATHTTPKGTRKRAQLLDAAEELLLASGHTGLSLRAVATAAGVRLGHLQYYFPTRADLVAAVLDRALTRSLDNLAPLLSPREPASPADPRQLIGLLLAEQDDPRLVRLFTELWALAAVDETVAVAVRTFYRAYQDQVAAFLRARHPALPAAACRARAAVFTMLIEGAALFRSGIADYPTEETDAELMATAMALLRNPADRNPADLP